jgi:hypothetical protein
VFLLKRKDDYRLKLSRTLKTPERYQVELYLFAPHENSFSTWALGEQQFFFHSLTHSFSLLGPSAKERVDETDSYFLLSPHYEIMYGSWLHRYTASMDRLRQQFQTADTLSDPVARGLRLSRTFAQRLRKSSPQQSNQQRYFRQMDIYFSWYAEQFLLESMTLENFKTMGEGLQQSVQEFLQQEYKYRKDCDYLSDLHGTPTRVWNRMSLYRRLLEYPTLLRSKIIVLGAGTKKLVKATSTVLIMALFTYFLFNARNTGQQLSLALLFIIALTYGIRDLLRDNMISGITRWLRKGKPRWKIRLTMPYTKKILAQQLVWLEYRQATELPRLLLERTRKWVTNENRQVICYRSRLHLEKAALGHDQIREHLSLDCEPLCEMIGATRHKLYVPADRNDPLASIEAHPIEKQQDYDLLLVCTDVDKGHSSAQRWRLRLSVKGIVECKSRDAHWPQPGSQEIEPAQGS